MPGLVGNRNSYSYFPSGHQKIQEWINALSAWGRANLVSNDLPIAASPASVALYTTVYDTGTATGQMFDVPKLPATGAATIVQQLIADYNAWLPRGTRSPQLVKNLETSEKIMLQTARRFIIPAFHSDLNYVSDDALAALSIRPRAGAHYSPYPPPSEAPLVNVLQAGLHTLKIVAMYPNAGGHTKYLANVPGIKGMAVYHRQSGTEGPWTVVNTTRLKTEIRFTPASQGQLHDFRVAFMNPTMQEGPQSDTVSAVVT